MASKQFGKWRIRIVGHDNVDPKSLIQNPKNWRIHNQNQRAILEGAIEKIGYLRSVTVNKVTGNIVDGHFRTSIAIANNEPLVPVEYVELSEEEEETALATLDPIATLASTDSAKLDELLQEISDIGNPVDALLNEMRIDVELEQSIEEGLKKRSEHSPINRESSEPRVQIKPVLYVDEVRILEQALRKTGLSNRSQALMAICKAFIGGNAQYDPFKNLGSD